MVGTTVVRFLCQRCVWGVINFVIINSVTYKLRNYELCNV
jgi:hypothetical protein